MATRKPILRLGPQPTSFVASRFAKGLSGYNWQYDRVKDVYRRRPGTYEAAPAVDERDRQNLYSFLNSSRPIYMPNGLRGLLTKDLQPSGSTFSSDGSYLLNMDTLVNTAGVLRSSNLFGFGVYPWAFLNADAVILDTITEGSLIVRVFDDDDGQKKVEVTYTATGDIVTVGTASNQNFLTLYNALNALPSLAGKLSVPPDSYGAYTSPLKYLPYGEQEIRPKASIESRVVVPLPMGEMYNPSNGAVWFSLLRLPFSDNDPTPLTFAKLGSYSYVAGGGMPLFRFDGSRAHVAGATPFLLGSPASLGFTGAGLTGTYTYKIMHRVYGPDGSYVDGEPCEVGTLNPVAQGIRVTLNRNSTLFSMYARRAAGVTSSVNGLPAVFACMYKCTDYVSVGDVNGYADLRLDCPGYVHKARFFTGDPLFRWDGTTLTKAYVGRIDNNGLPVDLLGVVPFTDRVCAGDVFVILRNVNGGTIFYERAEIPVGAAFFDDTMSDALLIQQPQYLEQTYSKLPPPTNTVAVCTHQTRIVVAHRADPQPLGAQDNQVRFPATFLSWSEAGTEHFPTENQIDLSGLCSKITGLASLNDILYILTDAGVFYIQGTLSGSPTTYTFGRLPGSVSCASPASVVVAHQQVWFITSFGELASISGLEVSCERNLLEEKAWQFSQAVAVHNADEDRTYFFVPEVQPPLYVSDLQFGLNTADQLYNSKDYYGTSGVCLVVDHQDKQRMIYTGVSASGGAAVIEGQVMMADRSAQRLSQLKSFDERAKSDSGTDIEMVVRSPFEDADSPHLHKTFQRLTVFAPDAESQFTLGVRVEKDWDERTYIQEFEQEFRTGEGYAEQPYATDPYGDGNIPDRSQDLAPVKAKSLRLSFVHEDKTEDPVLNGWVIELSDTTREGREE